MKAFVSAATLAIVLSCPVAMAQDQSATPPSPENSAHSKGTAPEGNSSTGWSGSGLGAAHTGKDGETTGSGQDGNASNSTASQPEMATGVDLNGPPERFPANNTPE